MRLTYGHVSEGIIRMIAEDNLKEKGNDMTPNEPNPNDLCECGHERKQHSGSGFTCFGRMASCSCTCTGFNPTTPQPVPVPVSEDVVQRVMKEMDDYWVPSKIPSERRAHALYHLEHLVSVQKERDMLRERDNERIDTDIEWVKKFHQCEQERDELKQRVKAVERDLEKAQTNADEYWSERNDLRRDNERLRGALEKYKDCYNIAATDRVNLESELSALSHDKEKLKEALKKYGQHDMACSDVCCVCGLSQALKL